MSDPVYDMQVVYHHHTDAAVKVALDFTTKGIWLPLSEVQVDEDLDDQFAGNLINITAPQWLLEKKELV